ncbi:hypothetical protein GBA65_19850 [Rubrobacter marinus]|uniref:Response regulatory domain-containing protein n=1 Tax=Rubrobacter marinus TaxID=2653852 RepID=A0A6G8Q1Q6_9ACTN|nr:hypothetical protein [Rubrobacter marinus]QIN80396.1 hypothetical protein GBA65_19850 [Rubrobacter marinus]
MRVLLANEPRAYRDVISGTLEALRPELEILTAEPGELDAEVLRLSPHFVLCSRVTPVVESRAPVWIELYPDQAPGAVVDLRGEREVLPEMRFEKLLSTVDRARLSFVLPA